MPLRRLLPMLAALVALAVGCLVTLLVGGEWQQVGRAERGEAAVASLRLALSAAEMVSRERGPTNAALGGLAANAAERHDVLRQARERSDRALALLQPALAADAANAAERDAAARLQDAGEALAQARAGIDALLARPQAQRDGNDIRRSVAGMVAVVPLLAPAVGLLADRATQALPVLSDAVQGARLVAELREYAGQLGSHFTAALTRQQPFTAGENAAIERTRGRIDELRFLIELRVRLPGQSLAVLQGWRLADEQYFQSAAASVAQVIASGQTDGRYGVDPADFAARYVPDMNTLFVLRDVLLDQATATAKAERMQATRSLWAVAAGASLLLLGLLAVMRQLNRRVLRPLAQVTQALKALASPEGPGSLSRLQPLPQPPARDEIAAVIGAVTALQQRELDRQALERERDSLIEQLRSQSSTDFLTGLPNRRAFFEAAERELAKSRRNLQPVVVILLDIDHFKQFNDRHGHRAGDDALVEVAQALQRTLRGGDLVARYGGEEFVLLLSGCDLTAGRVFAGRLRVAIADIRIALGEGLQESVTASLGVADSGRCGLELNTLLSHADAAMYRAKDGGRNRVVVAADATTAAPG